MKHETVSLPLKVYAMTHTLVECSQLAKTFSVSLDHGMTHRLHQTHSLVQKRKLLIRAHDSNGRGEFFYGAGKRRW